MDPNYRFFYGIAPKNTSGASVIDCLRGIRARTHIHSHTDLSACASVDYSLPASAHISWFEKWTLVFGDMQGLAGSTA